MSLWVILDIETKAEHFWWATSDNTILRYILKSVRIMSSSQCAQKRCHLLTLLTTVPAPIVLPLPTFLPGRMMTSAPMKQSSSMVMGAAIARLRAPPRARRSVGSVMV
ncbi:hypothetical protein BDZ85DRAFT_107790 [Elsinoe ampelina]|uniref:Uncharacterized protein n=1 Tax=Elsinoe ampelina TaxID=302913 RepID=A0A6A6GC87_9PEZI|nr:hypothetical protein BDZ85DRAFT_107790 [Elsinoe ampelina]